MEGASQAGQDGGSQMPSHVKIADLRVGLPVEYLGESDPIAVLDEKLQAVGLVLYSGHPGRVWSTLLQHVQVTWVGLEDEPATYALGFSVPDEDATCYRILGLLSEDEFRRRERALRDSLASGRNLSSWVPPWPHHDPLM
jgi:hypothetical protein